MKQYQYCFIFLTLLVVIISNVQCKILKNNDKVSQQIHSKYLVEHYNENSHHKTKLWIFFNKKSRDSNDKQIELINQENNKENLISKIEISERSKNRRIIRGGLNENELVDYHDLPVNSEFIQRIMNQCSNNQIDILNHRTSKWLNSVSISLNTKSTVISNQDNDKLVQEAIQCISSFNFVDKIDIVSQFIRDLPKDNNEFNEEYEKEEKEQLKQKLFSEDLISSSQRMVRKLENTNENTLGQLFYGNTFEGCQQIRIPELQSQGYDGSNITILMIDSGFYKGHDAFKSMKIIGEYDFINSDNNVTSELNSEQNKHGTATLSTIGGYVPGTLIGPAYNASFLLAMTEIVAAEERIEEDYWIEALEWGEKNGAELVSSSLGYTKWYNYSDLNSQIAPITIAADIAAQKGMVVVISAGNNANGGIGAPADGKNVISVGALYLDGKNTYFSSLGPSSDGRVKPDISALGYKNFVANHIGPSNYTLMSGTSFACPLAAGAIALLMQSQPTWTRQQIYDAIISTASVPQSPNIKIGYGVLNITAAFSYTPNIIQDNSTCSDSGCSGHGGCCNNQCFCSPDRYGSHCQYSRIECSYECGERGGKCQMDSFGFSFSCVDINASDYSYYNPNEVCSKCDSVVDKCGVCGGNSSICLGCDGVAFSDKVIDTCGVCGGNGECKKTITIEQPEHKSKLSLILGIALGSVATICIIVASIVLYKKRKVLSISSDGSLPFLKGYSKLENLDNTFSIGDDVDTY